MLVVCYLFLTTTLCLAATGRKKEKPDAQITAADLRISLMNYADMLSTVRAQITFSSTVVRLSTEVRRQVLGDLASTVFSVYTNAADPDPLIGLLNTVVIISFGEMIYEQHWYMKYGTPMEIVVNGLKTLEGEIWSIVSQVLTPEQQSELRKMIAERRKEFPDLVDFTQLWFNDFESFRKQSTLQSKVKSDGLLAPVSSDRKRRRSFDYVHGWSCRASGIVPGQSAHI